MSIPGLTINRLMTLSHPLTLYLKKIILMALLIWLNFRLKKARLILMSM
jgi:hypothetical protein